MVKDCPVCGLVNAPEAVRCDCGYDFVAAVLRHSYLSDKDQARAADAPRTVVPIPVPGGCLIGLFLTVLMNGTDQAGVILVLCASVGAFAGVVGTDLGPLWFLAAFGVVAGVGEVTTRRLRPPHAGRVGFVPVWALGVAVTIFAAVVLFARAVA